VLAAPGLPIVDPTVLEGTSATCCANLSHQYRLRLPLFVQIFVNIVFGAHL